MANNIIKKLTDGELLLAVGLLLVFVAQAKFMPSVVTGMIGGFVDIGALLIVIAAILTIISKFK